MYPALIQWFVTVVPMCPLVTPMYSILRLMGTDPASKILVIDDDDKPVGVVSCHELLLGLVYSQPLVYGDSVYEQMMLNPGKLTAVCSVLTGTHTGGTGTETLPKAIAQQSLQSCLESISKSSPLLSSPTPLKTPTPRLPIQPIACVPAHWSLQDFKDEFVNHLPSISSDQPMLQDSQRPSVEWVVVDRQGVALGLLNQEKVWRSLALAPQRQSEAINESDNSNPDSFRHIFVQRLAEAHTHIRNLTREQWEHKAQLQLKDDLMAYISHEIKTPLTALTGLSQLLIQKMGQMGGSFVSKPTQFPDALTRKSIGAHDRSNNRGNEKTIHTAKTHNNQRLDQPKQHSERQQLYAQLIHHSSQQLMALMGVLFELVHIETGQVTLSRQPVVLTGLCHEAYHQALEEYSLTEHPTESGLIEKQKTTAQPQDLATDLTGLGLPRITIEEGIVEVAVDEHRFKRLLSCLFFNALRLAAPPESLRLRIERWGTWISVKMIYSGIAIPAKQQAQIFQVLDISDESFPPLLKGIGVRLLLALRLAEEHGGTLTWLSSDTEESEVTVLFPCEKPLDVPRLSLSHPEMVVNLPFVVIADDEPSRIQRVFKAVSLLGYKVAIARSGSEALNKIRCLDAKIVILNPSMAYHPEATLLSILQQTPSLQAIPIIATEPMSTSTHATLSHEDMITTYLHFPLDSTVLQNQLAALTQTVIPPKPPPLNRPITLLYISPDLVDQPSASSIAPDEVDLKTILYPHHYRIIEVDNIDQAELLARVWHPDVIVFSLNPFSQTSDVPALGQTMIETLKDCGELAELPIVTLTSEMTELAYGLDLHVFPCLDPLMPVPSNDNPQIESLALLQVIQLAAASHSLSA